MVTFIESDDNKDVVNNIPEELPILPLRNTVAFPFSALPLVVGIPRSVELVKDVQKGNRLIGLLTAKDPSIEEPGPGQIYETGTVAKLYHMVKAPNDTLQVVVQGLERFRVDHWLGTEPYLRARITLIPDAVEWGEWQTGERNEGMLYSLTTLVRKVTASLAVPAVGLILQVTGYVPNAAQQPERALLGIRIAFGPLPAALLCLGILFALLYPLGREEYAKIASELAERRTAAAEEVA